MALLSLVVACTAQEPGAPAAHESSPRGELTADFGRAGRTAVFGVAEAPPVETDQRPRYALFAREGEGAAARQVAGAALDASVDGDTRTLAWIDAAATLWVAPLDTAPADKRAVAERALPGLAASRGRLAFATRIDGPETAPFVLDLRTLQTTALDDGPGPDEVLCFSPDGDEVLLLSGRTGLASLFAAGVDAPAIRQLTNVGLRPGPTLDPSKVAPAPVHARDVAWGPRGVAYRAEGAVMLLDGAGQLARIDTAAPLEEVVR